MTNEEAGKIVDEAIMGLKEHFDAVIILASRDYPENEKLSHFIQRGRGNWFAQRGMLREVLENDLARTMAIYVNEKPKSDVEGG